MGRARVLPAAGLACVLLRTFELSRANAFDFYILRIPLTSAVAGLSTRALGPTATAIDTVARMRTEISSAQTAHVVREYLPARRASTSLPARATTVCRADTSHLTATATALVIAAQGDSTNIPQAPFRAAAVQAARLPIQPAQSMPRIAIAQARLTRLD